MRRDAAPAQDLLAILNDTIHAFSFHGVTEIMPKTVESFFGLWP